ncbi:hypothetical protein [Frankia sp. QA3]|uniref:hypothetical protein n=1 Tax=Frankia sp. QA3 TaxID=710111 RepID=UPI000269CA75|nr:hypothetical protein [Frankia sp. QA3]EIV94906.1 hypothetical protein FraQA3DRAFT_4699 [Frankia sp. QA3]
MTNPAESNNDAAPPLTAAVVKLVTATMAAVVGLTFLFGFGNVLALGLRLGVPIWVAPLVAPAVDLSVLGLLLGTRHLAVHGGPAEVMRSARRLLIFSSTVTLALNIAEPLIAGDYGKAAFDAVGPLLLIGWSEVGPGLLQAIQSTGTTETTVPDTAVIKFRRRGENTTESAALAGRGKSEEPHQEESKFRGHRRRSSEQDLLHRARAEDTLHWSTHNRPISAETLRKRLRIGAPAARNLVTQLRTDTSARLHPALTAGTASPSTEPVDGP